MAFPWRPTNAGITLKGVIVAPAPCELELVADEKTVLLPTVVSRVVEPWLMVLTMGCVVMAVKVELGSPE